MWGVLGGLSSTEGCRQEKAVGLPYPDSSPKRDREILGQEERQLGARAQPRWSLVVFFSKRTGKLCLFVCFPILLISGWPAHGSGCPHIEQARASPSGKSLIFPKREWPLT